MNGLWIMIAALATYRLTRLVTADKITESMRDWVSRRSSTLGYLITCDWCLSIWIAPLISFVLVLHPEKDLVRWGLLALAFSALTGLLSLLERRLDP